MLKNIAIPLMLAASEAEAQRAPSREELEDALKGDRAKAIAGLIGVSTDACTTAVDDTTYNLKNLGTAVSDAENDLAAKQKAVDDLKTPGDATVDPVVPEGAWFAANKKREEAVSAAEQGEATDAIGEKLAALDAALEDERNKAAAYMVAKENYDAGVVAKDAAAALKVITDGKLSTLESAKTTAANAAQAAKDQHAKETLWREWRYCELGANATTLSDAKDFQQYFVTVGNYFSSANDDTSYTVAMTSTTTPDLDHCKVPAVTHDHDDDDTTAEETIRPAVTYFYNKTSLTVESDDGLSQWTAQVKLTAAEDAYKATSTATGESRTKAGDVAYYTHKLVQSKWRTNTRKSEQTFYGDLNSSRATAKGEANS